MLNILFLTKNFCDRQTTSLSKYQTRANKQTVFYKSFAFLVAFSYVDKTQLRGDNERLSVTTKILSQ